MKETKMLHAKASPYVLPGGVFTFLQTGDRHHEIGFYDRPFPTASPVHAFGQGFSA